MKKRVRRKQPKRPRRKDEASLYFLIERDLDRETIFSEHDGWYAQIGVGNGRIDYAIRYGDLVLGVEVKSGFPKRNHFRYVIDKYRDSFDALFLAILLIGLLKHFLSMAEGPVNSQRLV